MFAGPRTGGQFSQITKGFGGDVQDAGLENFTFAYASYVVIPDKNDSLFPGRATRHSDASGRGCAELPIVAGIMRGKITS